VLASIGSVKNYTKHYVPFFTLANNTE